MKKELKDEMDVAASANDIWAVYSSPDLPKLIVQLLPTVFDKIDIVEGNGGVGTVLHVTYPQGSVPLTYKEKFVTIDDEKRLKEVKQIEGGYLEMGCTFYMESFHIIEKGHNSCVIVSKTEYEVPNEEIESQVGPYISIDSLRKMATAISDYVLNRATRKEVKHELEVAASADDVWEGYRSPDVGSLICPHVFEKIELVEGDGGVGTVLQITHPPGYVPHTYKEKYVTLDDHKRLLEVEQIEGGYLEMGCTFYMDSIHVVKKGDNSCVIVSKAKYEVPKELASQVEPYIAADAVANMARIISNNVLEKKKS